MRVTTDSHQATVFTPLQVLRLAAVETNIFNQHHHLRLRHYGQQSLVSRQSSPPAINFLLPARLSLVYIWPPTFPFVTQTDRLPAAVRALSLYMRISGGQYEFEKIIAEYMIVKQSLSVSSVCTIKY